MKMSLTTCLLLTLGLIHPVNMLISAASEEESMFNMDGSGSEFGSASGDWSDDGRGESTNDVDYTNINSRMSDSSHWPKKDSEEGYIILGSGKSYLSDERVIAAIIAGSVTGMVMAIVLFTIGIYLRRNKDIGGCFLGNTQEVV